MFHARPEQLQRRRRAPRRESLRGGRPPAAIPGRRSRTHTPSSPRRRSTRPCLATRTRAKRGPEATESASGWTRGRRSRTRAPPRSSRAARVSPAQQRARANATRGARAPSSPPRASARARRGGAPWRRARARHSSSAVLSRRVVVMYDAMSDRSSHSSDAARARGARRTAATAGAAGTLGTESRRLRTPCSRFENRNPPARERTWRWCPHGPGRCRRAALLTRRRHPRPDAPRAPQRASASRLTTARHRFARSRPGLGEAAFGYTFGDELASSAASAAAAANRAAAADPSPFPPPGLSGQVSAVGSGPSENIRLEEVSPLCIHAENTASSSTRACRRLNAAARHRNGRVRVRVTSRRRRRSVRESALESASRAPSRRPSDASRAPSPTPAPRTPRRTPADARDRLRHLGGVGVQLSLDELLGIENAPDRAGSPEQETSDESHRAKRVRGARARARIARSAAVRSFSRYDSSSAYASASPPSPAPSLSRSARRLRVCSASCSRCRFAPTLATGTSAPLHRRLWRLERNEASARRGVRRAHLGFVQDVLDDRLRDVVLDLERRGHLLHRALRRVGGPAVHGRGPAQRGRRGREEMDDRLALLVVVVRGAGARARGVVVTRLQRARAVAGGAGRRPGLPSGAASGRRARSGVTFSANF